MQTTTEIIEHLKNLENEKNKAGMARFGINTGRAFGISMVEIKAIAKQIKKNHQLALELWKTEYHEARILAVLIADPKELSSETIDDWVKDFNSWDLCDQATMKLFCKNRMAFEKIYEWVVRDEEFVKRAGFALMASVALHNKSKDNELFLKLLKLIEKYPDDERNFVKKSVNWALRQIGKRNMFLNKSAINTCENILTNFQNSKAAKWVANDALRELTNEKILERIAKSRHN